MADDHTRLREIWRGMLKRCENPRCKDYKRYAGRRISVCEEWHDFDRFEEWALSHGYRDGLTIDRVNNNKGYGPGNCRWVSRRSQAANRRTNTYYTMDGRTMILKRWSEEYGVPVDRIVHRMEDGWSFERAVKTPVRRQGSSSKSSDDPPVQP